MPWGCVGKVGLLDPQIRSWLAFLLARSLKSFLQYFCLFLPVFYQSLLFLDFVTMIFFLSRCRIRLLLMRMFSTGQIRRCLWLPLVLLALVSSFPSKAQGQGKYYFFSVSPISCCSRCFSASHLSSIPSSSCSLLIPFIQHPVFKPPSTSYLDHPTSSHLFIHHSSILSSLRPHLSDLLYLHILPPSLTWPLRVFPFLVPTSLLSLSSPFDV